MKVLAVEFVVFVAFVAYDIGGSWTNGSLSRPVS